MSNEPMTEDMNAAAAPLDNTVPELLIRHLVAPSSERRPPAKIRLEQALGPDLARRLLTSLAAEPPHK